MVPNWNPLTNRWVAFFLDTLNVSIFRSNI
jgi:hypothetical protein